ncbi:hypothetical protein [Bacteroides stercoris]|jgi:hypothetical protein|nr:hypothetical protein [Bacteroides stercoris]
MATDYRNRASITVLYQLINYIAMKKITKIEIIMSVDEDADLYSRDITLNGEKVFHDEFKRNLLNTKDFIHVFTDKLISGIEND